MKGEPRKHHFVPECYLKLFTDHQKGFWKRKKTETRASPVTPAQVCWEWDSNTIRTESALLFNNLKDKYFIEKESFKKQENNYNNTVNKVIKFSAMPSLVEKNKYHLFLETLMTIKRRNPVSRKIIINAFQEGLNSPDYMPTLRTLLKEEYGEEYLTQIDEHINRFIKKETQNPDRVYDMYLDAYINKTDRTTIRDITDNLYGLKQYILHAPIGTQFITSDNPGFTISNDRVWPLGGFGNAFEFYFPLAPNACLLLKSMDREKLDDLQKAIYPVFIEKSEVQRINQVTKGMADKLIFSYCKNILEHM